MKKIPALLTTTVVLTTLGTFGGPIVGNVHADQIKMSQISNNNQINKVRNALTSARVEGGLSEEAEADLGTIINPYASDQDVSDAMFNIFFKARNSDGTGQYWTIQQLIKTLEAEGINIPEGPKAPNQGEIDADVAWFKAQPKEQFKLSVEDNGNPIELSANYLKNGNSKKTAIVAHGYRGQNTDMGAWAKIYYDMGYNVLMPDARGHGESQSADNTITFGWKEKDDYVKWINLINNKNGNDDATKVVLQGVSMGAATVMMTGGEELPSNVKGIIEDCGYSSLSEQLERLEYEPLLEGLPTVAKLHEDHIENIDRLMYEKFKKQEGFSIDDVSSTNQVVKSITPTLFIHGMNDTFVPYKMLDQVYNASTVPGKDILRVEKAGHGQALSYDYYGYRLKVKSFLGE